MMSEKRKTQIPYSVWAIGIASCLINISSSLVFALSAVYLNTTLKIATNWIGLLEGAVEACAYGTKIFSGVISDYFRRRKSIMLIGFIMTMIARPVLALSATFWAVFSARLLDRFGNGVQSTPRDALVADLSPIDIKGECFGLRQALASAGSFLGGILGVIAMWWTSSNYQKVFWIAAIPAVFAVIILFFFVKDPPLKPNEIEEKTHTPKKHPLHFSDLSRLGHPFWILMIVAGVFMLARVSEAMLILHAHKNFGLSESMTPMILILYNGSNSLASYPIGRLSDRVPRQVLLGLGFLTLIASDIFLSAATHLWMVLIGVAIWGIQIGITQSMFLALIADRIPDDLRGTGFGIFYLFSSISLIGAGFFGGLIADQAGYSVMFATSSCIAGVALILLIVAERIKTKRH
jgi:MFS family permease